MTPPKPRTIGGWYLAAIAIALAFYAGFPEVAYFNGLFALGWAAVRLFSCRAIHVVAPSVASASPAASAFCSRCRY